jgi:hypothetical protein
MTTLYGNTCQQAKTSEVRVILYVNGIALEEAVLVRRHASFVGDEITLTGCFRKVLKKGDHLTLGIEPVPHDANTPALQYTVPEKGAVLSVEQSRWF